MSRVTGRPQRNQTRLLNQIEQLVGEIDRLHPSVDDGGRRPDNCEYPWDDGAGNVLAPAEQTFPNLDLLTQHAGRTLLKIIAVALDGLPTTL